MQLLVVCHGETGYEKSKTLLGWLDKALDEQGVLAVNQYASFLIQQQEQIDLVITSPLTRARQTGMIISNGLGCKMIENELIKERNFGDFSGKSLEQIQKEFSQLEDVTAAELFEGFPKAETIADVKTRVNKFVHFLIQLRNGGRYEKIMIISHNLIIRLLLQVLRDYSDQEALELPIIALSKFEIEI